MKQLIHALLTVFLLCCPLGGTASADPATLPPPRAPLDTSGFLEGDVIFQPSALSVQSLAIQIATRSRYSHCGIITIRDGEPWVFEAIRTVTWTPLAAWIKRGVDGHYVLMRIKDRDTVLGSREIRAMKEAAQSFANKKYDLYFKWTDDEIYCSELIWKIYERGAGLELAPLRRIRDYDLKHEEVQKRIKERYGYDVPWDERVIAPSDLMESPLLEKVGWN